MPQWNDFAACIRVDGRPLPEHRTLTQTVEQRSNSAGTGKVPVVSCWVASEVGKKFSVMWRNAAYPHTTGGFVKMDGQKCAGMFLLRERLPQTVELSGVAESESEERGGDAGGLRPFVFAPLVLSDDDALLDSPSNEELGTIELAIVPVHNFAEGAITTPRLDSLEVHERTKNVGAQQVQLGQRTTLARPITTFIAERSGLDVVRFVFRYRPLAVLRAKGIVASPDDDKEEGSSSSRRPSRSATLVEPQPLLGLGVRVKTPPDDEDEVEAQKRDAEILARLKEEEDVVRARMALRVGNGKAKGKKRERECVKEEDVGVDDMDVVEIPTPATWVGRDEKRKGGSVKQKVLALDPLRKPKVRPESKKARLKVEGNDTKPKPKREDGMAVKSEGRAAKRTVHKREIIDLTLD
ncbi:hypothetical protein HMN09_00735800 [Mycena chlorophos]|uniref:DUF7918 domain-containing protein n=1 Tax=Mycena chlorophos TaxID=658473 RepID=A0A8H6W4V0_MYCCL|nr:hypothetical protein HMN09_00735800 [Mycena chlorophos]